MVPAPIQIGEQGREPAGEIGEYGDPRLIAESAFEDLRIGLLEAAPDDAVSLPFEGPGQDGPRTESVGVVVMEQMDRIARPIRQLADRLFHRLDQLVAHRHLFPKMHWRLNNI